MTFRAVVATVMVWSASIGDAAFLALLRQLRQAAEVWGFGYYLNRQVLKGMERNVKVRDRMIQIGDALSAPFPLAALDAGGNASAAGRALADLVEAFLQHHADIATSALFLLFAELQDLARELDLVEHFERAARQAMANDAGLLARLVGFLGSIGFSVDDGCE